MSDAPLTLRDLDAAHALLRAELSRRAGARPQDWRFAAAPRGKPFLLDPPRAGARAQMEQIAKSDVPRVISVACDVQSFARDAKILVEAGYVFHHVVPVDQFAFSPHLEMIGLFTKTVATKRKRRLLG